MSYLPMITSIFETSPYERPGSKKRINNYYEGFLDLESASYIGGIDDGIATVSDAFLNLEDAEGFEYTNFDISKIDWEKLQDYVMSDYDPFENYDADELSKLSNETKVAMLFYCHIMEVLYNERNEAGISFTEQMDDADLEGNKEEFFSGDYLNFIEFFKKDNDEDGSYAKKVAEAKKIWEEEKMNENQKKRLETYQEKINETKKTDDVTIKRLKAYASKTGQLK